MRGPRSSLLVGIVLCLAGASAAGVAAQSEDPVLGPTSIDGVLDAGGVGLYLSCEGSGSPTIVYLHGSIDDASFSGASSAIGLQASLKDHYRFCRYDRRNVGLSEEVEGYFTGLTTAEDLHALLAAAEVEPPYVLLGASFGGLLAHIYAGTYPGEVVGMVLLDSPVPEEVDLDPLLPEDMRFQPDEDLTHNEKLSHYAAYHEARALPAQDIPLVYLLATPSEWPTLGVPAYDDVILDVIADHVASYPRGTLREVESPHYMEVAVPDTIVESLLEVIASAQS